MNRSSRRINKKKAIPLCFQKSHSKSQFLVEANYKHQIKKLKKSNKELACSLQDAKCRAADQERALAECTRENTQTLFVKMKIKDIVETVKKLVTDLSVVYDVIDGKTFDFLGNSSANHQEVRLKILNPSVSTIEESASMSTIEPDLSTEECLPVESSTRFTKDELPVVTPFFDADSSKTEIYNVPLVLFSEQKLQDDSNGNQSAITRSSKSLEGTGSIPLDPETPPTPQPPVLTENFLLSIESQNTRDFSKLKPITSISTSKSTSKSTISKIPVKRPAASTEDSSPLLTDPSSYMNRRKTFVVGGKTEETQTSVPVSDQRGNTVLNSLKEDAKSDVIYDRRGTFVLREVPDNAKSDKTQDRRGTFVLKPSTDTKPDAVLDRRGTYFIPTKSKEQPDISPPKVIETHNLVQNPAPNQTILLCEDMDLTEILPFQNQSRQFLPVVPAWNETLETAKPGSSENLPASIRGQPLCTTSLVKKLPVSSINSSNQLEASATHKVVKDVQIQNKINVKNDLDNKLLASNILAKKKLWAETSAPNQDVNSTDLLQKRNKEKDVENKLSKKPDINVCIKCSTNKPPSPIAYYAKPNMSIQHKIFESFSALKTLPNKNVPTSDSGLVAISDDLKESTVLKDPLSSNEPTAEKVTKKEDAESPKTRRRSSRKKNTNFDAFFSDSDVSDIKLDEDFVPEKRFSLKPGRKIINPNNNKVFVFKKNSKKLDTGEDTPTNSSPDKFVDEDIKKDLENDIFDFSASSEADKSPLIKNKKRKSVLPKNKRSVKQSDAGKRLSKTTNKRSSKQEINKDEVPVTAQPRKSILCSNRSSSPMPLRLSSQFNRKSVRFSLAGTALQDKINNPKNESPFEENATAVNQEPDDIHDTEKVSTHNVQSSQGKRLSSKKKCISARSNSLTATGDILKSSSAKPKKSRKRQSCNLNLDSLEDACESDCSPKKRSQISNETSPQNAETHTNLSSGKQKLSKDAEDGLEPSQGTSGTSSSEVLEEKLAIWKAEKNDRTPNPDENIKVAESADEVEKNYISKAKRPFSGVSKCKTNKKQSIVDEFLPLEAHEEKPADNKKEKNSGGILSELPQNCNVKATESAEENEETKVNNAKRPFSGVSERRSKKKSSIVDELFPLNDAICEIFDDNLETDFKLAVDEPTEIYNVKEVETDSNKGKSATIKTPKEKSGKKKSSKRKKTPSKKSKGKENALNTAESKLDVLTSLRGSLFNECVEKTVKPKNSRKKKESTLSLQDNDIKADVLTSMDAIGSDEAVSGRSKRNRKVINFKEPSLNVKMRRE